MSFFWKHSCFNSPSREKTWKADKARQRLEWEVSLFSCLFSSAPRKVSMEQGLKLMVQCYCGCIRLSCCLWLCFWKHSQKEIFNITVHFINQEQTVTQFLWLPIRCDFCKSHIRQLKKYKKKGDVVTILWNNLNPIQWVSEVEVGRSKDDHLHPPVLRLRISGPIPSIHHTLSWRA